jgi:hypothetical protein
VWRIEGVSFSLDCNFRPAPVLCDNNRSALPIDFQEHIIAEYHAAGMRLKDANSGFEPKYFDEVRSRDGKRCSALAMRRIASRSTNRARSTTAFA